MDDMDLWEAIGPVVEFGREEALIDLKSEMYELKDEGDKGEFVKDVSAIANTLKQSDGRGYIVIGVLDAKQCPDRSNLMQYIVGYEHPDPDQLCCQMIDVLSHYIEPCPTVDYVQTLCQEAGITISVVTIQGWPEMSDDRPYVVREDVDRLRQSQVWIRRGPKGARASRHEITMMIQTHLKSVHDREMHQLQEEFEARLAEAQEEIDHLRNDLGYRENEYARETQWWEDKVKALQADNGVIARDSSGWRMLAHGVCRELYRTLPTDSRDHLIQRLLAHYDKEEYYEIWFRSE